MKNTIKESTTIDMKSDFTLQVPYSLNQSSKAKFILSSFYLKPNSCKLISGLILGWYRLKHFGFRVSVPTPYVD